MSWLVYCQEQVPSPYYYTPHSLHWLPVRQRIVFWDRTSREEMCPWCRYCLSTETLCSAGKYLRSLSATVCITWMGRVLSRTEKYGWVCRQLLCVPLASHSEQVLAVAEIYLFEQRRSPSGAVSAFLRVWRGLRLSLLTYFINSSNLNFVNVDR